MRIKKAICIFLLVVTVCLKNGSILSFDWADYFNREENWNKVFYSILNNHCMDKCQKTEIPADEVLWINVK